MPTSKPCSVAARLGGIGVLAVVAAAGTVLPADAQRPADVVLTGAAVYTVDAARSWADAVAIRDGEIVYVGTDRGSRDWVGPDTRTIQLDGRMIMPGFHDSHVHPVSGGVERLQCDLNGIADRPSLLVAVRQCAEDVGPDEWVVGGGWDLPLFPNGVALAATLDSLVAGRPAYLTSSDAHTAWVSSRALEIAGIGVDTPDPPQGRIDRSPATGGPLGTLREAAMDLVTVHLPEVTADQRLEGLRRALEIANRFGITSVVEANADEAALAAYQTAEREGWLTTRVVASQRVVPGQGAAQIAELVRLRDRYGRGELFRPNAAKLFADGVIEAKTGALLEPYVGSDDRGTSNFEPEVYRDLIRGLDAAGFQIHVHAIGDRAIRETLDAIESARQVNGDRDTRHHLAHIQLWDPEDIPRLRRLGVVANFQPLWAYADRYITELTEPVLGPERSRWLYPIRSVLATGAVVVAGSDWSVTSMNPLDGMQVAVTRQPLDGSLEPWIPEERVMLADIIAAYTINGAYLTHQESETGSIEVGKAADLVVIDRNLFEIDPHDIHRARVQGTMLRGEWIFREGLPD